MMRTTCALGAVVAVAVLSGCGSSDDTPLVDLGALGGATQPNTQPSLGEASGGTSDETPAQDDAPSTDATGQAYPFGEPHQGRRAKITISGPKDTTTGTYAHPGPESPGWIVLVTIENTSDRPYGGGLLDVEATADGKEVPLVYDTSKYPGKNRLSSMMVAPGQTNSTPLLFLGAPGTKRTVTVTFHPERTTAQWTGE